MEKTASLNITNRPQHRFIPFRGLVTGLATTQAVFTCHVYFSNKALYQSMQAVEGAGYLPVPNSLVMESLLSVKTAFWGGLFYTTTIGAALSILTIITAWCWHGYFLGNKYVLGLGIVLWAAALVAVNAGGINPAGSLCFLTVPAAVFITVSRSMAKKPFHTEHPGRLGHLVPILLLAAVWWPQFNAGFFTQFRDRVLLTNSPGKAVNDFYYTYTLYAAEAIKPLASKSIKTCGWLHGGKDALSRSLEKHLADRDYLMIEGYTSPDLQIAASQKAWTFLHDHNRVTTVHRDTFADDPTRLDRHLNSFSAAVDTHAFLRRMVFFGLLLGFPSAIYITIYTLAALLGSFFLSDRTSSYAAVLLCFLLGCGGLLLFTTASPPSVSPQALGGALKSPNRHFRVAGLKTAYQRGMDIAGFQTHISMATSQYVPERYWLARALGAGNHPETLNTLLRLLQDPHPNVVCMTLDALGRRGKERMIPSIMHMATTSSHWYVQWYAYKALKALGWRQNQSR